MTTDHLELPWPGPGQHISSCQSAQQDPIRERGGDLESPTTEGERREGDEVSDFLTSFPTLYVYLQGRHVVSIV